MPDDGRLFCTLFFYWLIHILLLYICTNIYVINIIAIWVNDGPLSVCFAITCDIVLYDDLEYIYIYILYPTLMKHTQNTHTIS